MSLTQLFKIRCSDCGSDSDLVMCKDETEYELELCTSCIEERENSDGDDEEE